MSEADNYPLSSPRGDSIPFDVGYPHGLISVSITAEASSPVTLPADALLAVFYSSCDSIICFDSLTPAAVTEDAYLPLSVFIPASSVVSLQLPTLVFTVIAASSTIGKLRVNLFRTWQSIGKDLLGRRM